MGENKRLIQVDNMSKGIFWMFKEEQQEQTPPKIKLEHLEIGRGTSHTVLKNRDAPSWPCLSIRIASPSSNKTAMCTGQAVLFHFLGSGPGETKDNAIEKPLWRQDDKRWDYNLRGQKHRTGETDKWWELRSTLRDFTNDRLIFFYFGYENDMPWWLAH